MNNPSKSYSNSHYQNSNNSIGLSSSNEYNHTKNIKLQRFCFEFPSNCMKNYSKIVADYANFATIL